MSTVAKILTFAAVLSVLILLVSLVGWIGIYETILLILVAALITWIVALLRDRTQRFANRNAKPS